MKKAIKDKKVKEGAKPDFLDMDKDGNKKEPMKKAIKDKKVKEGFPTVDDARKRHEQEKGTGKFDKKETGDGRTQYTRKASTFTDGGDDSDVKAAKKKDKKVKEAGDDGRLTYTRKPDGSSSVSSSTGRVQATLGTDGKMAVKPGTPQGGQSAQTTPSDKLKKEKEVQETTKKCNHSPKGKSCPVHGLKECGSMPMESKPSAGLSAAKKSSIVKKATSGGDIGKPGKSFDKVAAKAGGGEKGKKIAAAAMWKNAAR